MRFHRDLIKRCYWVFGFGVITFKQLFGSQHHLVRGFTSPAAPPHAIGQYGEKASLHPGMLHQHNLVLLVIPVALVNAGGGRYSIALFGHVFTRASTKDHSWPFGLGSK